MGLPIQLENRYNAIPEFSGNADLEFFRLRVRGFLFNVNSR
jgi:hypothetical protein